MHYQGDNDKKVDNDLLHAESKRLLRETRIQDFNRRRMECLVVRPDISG